MKNFILILLGSLLPHSGAHGALMLYRFSGFASGTISGTPFTEAAFNIRVLADTDNIIPYDPVFSLDAISAAIEIVGAGSGAFTQAGRVFATPSNNAVGFSEAGVNGIDILDLVNSPAFSLYDLKSELPATSGSTFYVGGSTYPSSLGDIRLTKVTSGTFSATAVPEPSAAVTAGLAGLGLMRRHRRRPVKASFKGFPGSDPRNSAGKIEAESV